MQDCACSGHGFIGLGFPEGCEKLCSPDGTSCFGLLHLVRPCGDWFFCLFGIFDPPFMDSAFISKGLGFFFSLDYILRLSQSVKAKQYGYLYVAHFSSFKGQVYLWLTVFAIG